MRERASNQGQTNHASGPAVLENGQNEIEMVTPRGNAVDSEGVDMNPPTQEEEDEAIRRRPLGRRIIETLFPRFTRPVRHGFSGASEA